MLLLYKHFEITCTMVTKLHGIESKISRGCNTFNYSILQQYSPLFQCFPVLSSTAKILKFVETMDTKLFRQFCSFQSNYSQCTKYVSITPDTGLNLKVHKTFRRR